MGKIATSGVQTGMLANQLMARGFTAQGAGELVGGKPVTQANDLTRMAAAMPQVNALTNLQSLQLQQQMQSLNRQMTLMSNIMKFKHDTVKSIIGNIR
ncbi:MAG: hypothetical protein FJ290_15605 [Planctomycetes bacterium]|nr:hypothetical protein [Planctomycetota bacterium]